MWQRLALTVAAAMPIIGCAGTVGTAKPAEPAPAVATAAGQSNVFGDAASSYTLFSVDGQKLPYARPLRDAALMPAVILSGTLLLQPNGVFTQSTTYREMLDRGERTYDGKLTGACAPNADGFRMYMDEGAEAQLSVSGDTATVDNNGMIFKYVKRR